MKKLFILINSFLILLCLFVPIYADDDESEKSDTEISETNENKEINEKIDNLEKEILEIKENNSKRGNIGGYKVNFNDLSYPQIKYYYDNYSSIDLAVIFAYPSGGYKLQVYNYSLGDYEITLNNDYYFDFIMIYTTVIYPNGRVERQNYSNLRPEYRLYKLQQSYDNDMGFYKSSIDYEYYLTPYHLRIINNGIGEITADIPSNYGDQDSLDWYLYSNQEVEISYGDLDDFTGWYDINGNLVSNDENYIFNITQDTTLIVNYYPNPQTFDYTNLLYIIIGLLIFIFFNDITKGVLN